ncbi:fimbrial protein [Serratia fonticola]|uniref:fimbrial protein n=1 Tax=Serratia fonticola TaxID=47917 RepID=UPI003F5C2365
MMTNSIKNRHCYRPLRYLGLLMSCLLLSHQVHSEANMHFHGALVAEPCVIPAGEENIALDFGTVLDKYLYLNQRTNGKPFVINLTQCDLSLGNVVTFAFSGIENPALTGMLALAPGSQASGVGIGMETPEGQFLPLNKSGQAYTLLPGSNAITVHAYLQGEPEAIANEGIERGPFSAIATFSLEYQ